jgi:hypothetical protein
VLIDYVKLASVVTPLEGVVDHIKLGEYDRRYYLRNKAKIKAKNRQWRSKNKHKIKRRQRIYKRQLKMGRKPRRRVGAPGAGYTYISRGGVKFQKGQRY